MKRRKRPRRNLHCPPVVGAVTMLLAVVPSVRAQVAYQSFTEAKATTDSTSITISTPASTSSGDLLIAAVVTDGDNTGSLAPPAGENWALVALDQQGSAVTLGVWWKIAETSESASHQFTWSTSEQAYAWMMRFTGHDAVAPIDAWATNGGTASSATSPAVTTTIADTMILRIGGFDHGDVTVDSPGLAGHTAITMDESNTDTTACSGGAGYVAQAAVGSSGTSTFSLTASEEYRAVTIAIAQSPTIDLANGLIAFWKLNEGSGTNATDSSTNANDGTLTNSPAWIDGVHGGAVNFDGVDDFIDAGSDASIDDLFSGGATFAVWIFIKGAGENTFGRIADKASDVFATDGWALEMNAATTSLRFEVGFTTSRGVWTIPTNSVNTNSWYHVAVVYDSDSDTNAAAIYINGVSQTVTVDTTPSGTFKTDAAIALRIGNFAGGATRTFDGNMDDIRIYNRKLSAGEIARLANGSGLIGHWKFDDAVGVTATDSVDGNDGTLTNGPTWTTSGKLCGALDFNEPDNEYVNVPANASLDISSDATITGWFKLDATFNSSSTTSQIILEKYLSNDQDMLIVLVGTDYNNANFTDGSLGFKIENGAGGKTYRYKDTTTVSWTAGQWYHFAATLDVSDVTLNQIFINGVDVTDGAGTGGTGGDVMDMSFNADINIGGKDADTAQLATARYFDGVIDDVRIFNRILLPWEIRNLAAEYQVVDLGALSAARHSLGGAINDSEQIAGFDEDTSTGNPTAWRSQYCDYTALGTLTGGSIAEARGINTAGKIVGWSDDTAGDRKAFLWVSGSGMSDLGTLSGRSDSEAIAINTSDEVAGTALNFSSAIKDRLAFLYLPVAKYSLSTGMNSLGTLGGDESVAMDVNDSGETVGGAQDSSANMRPFIWLPSANYSLSAGMNDLGTLGGDSKNILHRAQAINNSGETVGLSYTAGGEAHAFMWLPSAAHTLSAGMNDLGTLSSGDTSWALDVNSSGVVVGTSNLSAAGTTYHAFVWKDGTMTDLNNLIDSNSNWVLTRATGINTDGEIVGWGTNPSSKTRAFILTQSCSVSATSSAIASTLGPIIAEGSGETNADGFFEEIAAGEGGRILGSVAVFALTAGYEVEFAVRGRSEPDDGRSSDARSIPGFVDGVGLARTLVVASRAIPRESIVTVAMTIDDRELESLGVEPGELAIHVLDPAAGGPSGTWVVAGKHIGRSEPTGVVGESGYVQYDDGSIEYWAAGNQPGIFGVGAFAAEGRRDDEVSSPTTRGPPMCGIGALSAILFSWTVLFGVRLDERRKKRGP